MGKAGEICTVSVGGRAWVEMFILKGNLQDITARRSCHKWYELKYGYSK